MSFADNPLDSQLIFRLQNEGRSAFTIIFRKYYNDLVHYAYSLVQDVTQSEEIAQEVFVKLWENREKNLVHSSLKSYLLSAVHNKSVDFMRHHEVAGRYSAFALAEAYDSQNNIEAYVLHSDLRKHYTKALDRIPRVYSQVFIMSRNESLTYAEIAERLGVSVRTVEVRMGKALSLLREDLKEYL